MICFLFLFFGLDWATKTKQLVQNHAGILWQIENWTFLYQVSTKWFTSMKNPQIQICNLPKV